MSSHNIHPSHSRLQELIDSGQLTDAHPFLQEVSLFSNIFGKLSNDPGRGFTGIQDRYQGLMYLQGRMRQAKSGKAAYNIYLGKYNVGSGNRYFVNSDALPPRIESVSRFGLLPTSWIKKKICPALFDGVLIQFLLVLLDKVPAVTTVTMRSAVSLTAFASILF